MAQKFHKVYGGTAKTGTSQRQPIAGREAEMVKNAAGGYGFTLDVWAQLTRFLVLGTEGGTYYTSETKLTLDNAKAVMKLIKSDGAKVVDMVADVSVHGKAYKQGPALFVLAMALAFGDLPTKRKVGEVFSVVIRIPTHLFTFLMYVDSMRGWGGSLRRMLQRWYSALPLQVLVRLITKYPAREGWSHADVLRKAHVKPLEAKVEAVYGYAVDKVKHPAWTTQDGPAFDYLRAIQELQGEVTNSRVVELILQHKLPREVLPTALLTRKWVWRALLQDMPMTAMIRNLGKMSEVGLFGVLPKIKDSKGLGKLEIPEGLKLPNTQQKGATAAYEPDLSDVVVTRLGDAEALKKARVHPIQILAALMTYRSGHGAKGKLTWDVNPAIVQALDKAFYLCFQNIKPVGKSLLFGVDVSGSMTSGTIAGVPGLTPRVAAAAMALACAKTESTYYIMGFADDFVDLGITADMRLQDVMHKMDRADFGSTDCAMPMQWAKLHKLAVHGFVIITDNETWVGDIQPTEALAQYRKFSGINARLGVIAMTATDFTIADPADAGQMDFVGFSTDTPAALADFLRGDL